MSPESESAATYDTAYGRDVFKTKLDAYVKNAEMVRNIALGLLEAHERDFAELLELRRENAKLKVDLNLALGALPKRKKRTGR